MRLLHLTTVLVADDLTTTSASALRTAAALRDAGGASMHIAHVVPADSGMVSQSGKRAEFLQAMTEAAARAKIRKDYTPHVLTGSVAEGVATLADRISADVIITGRRRTRPAVRMDRPLGGTAYSIITRSLVPCLAVHEPLTIPLTQVLVAIDSSEASRGALLVGLSWASALRARSGKAPVLTALHVHAGDASSDQAQSKRVVDHELEILQRASGAWAGVDVTGITKPGSDAAGVIAEHAASIGAELVVLGTRGPNAHGRDAHGRGTIGSVSAAVLAKVDAPVLLVPPALWRDYAKDLDDF